MLDADCAVNVRPTRPLVVVASPNGARNLDGPGRVHRWAADEPEYGRGQWPASVDADAVVVDAVFAGEKRELDAVSLIFLRGRDVIGGVVADNLGGTGDDDAVRRTGSAGRHNGHNGEGAVHGEVSKEAEADNQF